MNRIEPHWARLAVALDRWGGRPTLVAIAAMNAVTGLAVAAILAPVAFGQDADQYRSCAELVAEGQASFCGLLYPPLTALVARPLTWLSPTTAGVAMTSIGLAILLAGLVIETRGKALADRVLIAIAAIGFAPVVYELLLGQVTFLIAAAIYPIARRQDAFRNGVPLGVALAVAPKPVLVAMMVWMAVWRRHALAAAVLIGASLTCAGIPLLGSGQYQAWLSVIGEAGRESATGNLALSLHGNLSLWPINPVTFAIASAVAIATLAAILGDCHRGFVAALLASLLLAPYTGLYSLSILLLAVKPALAFAPRVVRVLAVTSNVALVFLLASVAWSIGGICGCLPVTRTRKGQSAVGGSVTA